MAMKLDLLPTERKKFGFDIVIALMFVLIAISGIGFYLYGNKLKEDAEAKKLEVAGIQKKIEDEKKDLGDIDSLRAKLKDLQANIDTVKTLKLDPVRYSNLLDELSSLLPNNMWVSNIAIDTQKNTLTLTGVAAEQPGVRPVESISGLIPRVVTNFFIFSLSTAWNASTAGTFLESDRAYLIVIFCCMHWGKLLSNTYDVYVAGFNSAPAATLNSGIKEGDKLYSINCKCNNQHRFCNNLQSSIY